MLLYNYDELKRITKTENGKKIIFGVKKAYDTLFKDKPIPVTNYAYQKLIYKTGNRDLHQQIYYERRKRLCFLQLLALDNDEYLDELENILAVICEEYTWVLPAHCVQKDNTFDYGVIDLFSAETGYYLAETAYVFGDKLSVDIRNRIKFELKRRIIDNYENRDQLWYGIHNNWAAVCGGSVGITYMYAFPERFNAIKDRLIKTMECYLDGTNQEGTTPEGVGYWVYGCGFFIQFFDIYNQFTGDYPEILNRTKVKNTVKYIENARLGGNCYLPYADGGHKQTYIHPPVAYSAKRLFGDAYVLPEYKIDDEFISHLPENTGKASAFRVLYGVDKFGLGDKIDVKEESIYYKESQIFIHKNKKYAFTAKGGCNLEMHNHNDIASFQIVIDGKGVVVDPGPAKYTWEYFNGGPEYRYSEEVFAAGSMGHSVPIVDGGYQFEGAKARAEILEATETNFKMDIASAYNCVESLVVNYQMLDDSIKVAYDCKGIKESITFRFLSFNKPEITVDGINVGVLVKSVSGLMPKIKEIKYRGHVNIMSASDYETIYAIDFTVDGKSNVKEEFEFII